MALPPDMKVEACQFIALPTNVRGGWVYYVEEVRHFLRIAKDLGFISECVHFSPVVRRQWMTQITLPLCLKRGH